MATPFRGVLGRTGGGGGGGPYGGVPAPIDIPPNLFAQTAGVVPNLGALTAGAGRNIGDEIAGVLSPDTLKAIQDEGAAWGVGAGMPGFTPGSLVQNRALRNLGLDVEKTKRAGTQDLLSLLGGVGGAMTPQSLAADIASRNALFAAAPDPAAAAAEADRRWMEKFNLTRGAGGRSLTWADLYGGGGAGGPAGGTLGFGTGRPNFLGGFDAGMGGPPEVAAGALGPFETPTRGGAPSYTLTGSTFGGGPGGTAKQPYDEVLDAFFNPTDYVWDQPGQEQAQTSGGYEE